MERSPVVPPLAGWGSQFRILKLFVFDFIFFRDVAQPGSAHVWGAWGRKFESCHPDFLKISTFVEIFLCRIMFTFYKV